MKKNILISTIILGVAFTACTNRNSSDSQVQKSDSTVNKTSEKMENLVSIVEIPASDLSRAIIFYQMVLDVRIEKMEMGGVEMGVLPGSGETVNVVLVKGEGYKPSVDGALVYLNAGDDLQTTLDKIQANGGKVLVPKTEISPEMGFFALFTDTEGNKLGLHSSH